MIYLILFLFNNYKCTFIEFKIKISIKLKIKSHINIKLKIKSYNLSEKHITLIATFFN